MTYLTSFSRSIRSGLNFFSSSVAVLIGTPINGALLGDKYAWERPIIFSGVFMHC
jgi:hypothetical protein